jgi:hypothetical protein
MKTLEQVKTEYNSDCLDSRDIMRLAAFVPEEKLGDFGLSINEGCEGQHHHVEFTKDNVLLQLEKDVHFGFEKALNKRGISAGLMYEVVKMWNWILEEGLEDFDSYAMYGLPLFKATAEKYGFPNPIGEDHGNEDKYNG